MSYRIGNDLKGKAWRLPAEFVTETSAILGRRGSGKTHTAVILAEEMLASGQQIVVIDPLGVWYGLRSSADGKSDGFPIILVGGGKADVPIKPEDGRIIAEFVAREGVPVILDLSRLSGSGLKTSSKSAQRRFVADFLERFYDLKMENRSPVHVLIDEADEFIPQRYAGDAARCVGSVDAIVRRGRALGMGVTLISQRAAVVNKDVLTQAELLVAHQTTGVQDRKALQAWVEAHDEDDHGPEFMKTVASLPRGRGWFWSPAWLNCFALVEVRERKTFDSSATPKAGAKKAEPKRLADVDIEALKIQLAATIEEARENDPRELKRRIGALEQDLRIARNVGPIVDEDELARQIAEVEAHWKAQADAIREDAAERFGSLRSELQRIVEQVRKAVDGIDFDKFIVEECTAPRPFTPSAAPRHAPQPPRVAAVRPRVALEGESSGESLGKCERALLTTALMFKSGCTKPRLSAISGYSIKSTSFQKYLSSLASRGLIVRQGDLIVATDAAELAIPNVPPLPGGAELLAMWKGKLGKASAAFLDALASVYPRAITKEELGQLSGYSVTSTSMSKYLSELRSLQLAEGYSEIRLADCFFK